MTSIGGPVKSFCFDTAAKIVIFVLTTAGFGAFGFMCFRYAADSGGYGFAALLATIAYPFVSMAIMRADRLIP